MGAAARAGSRQIESAAMRADFEVRVESGAVGVWDASAPPAAGDPRDASFVQRLRERAKGAGLFFIDAEDPVRYKIHVAVDEEPDPAAAAWCESSGGAFRLDLPSGTLVLGDAADVGSERRVSCAPGQYLLTAYARREFDSTRHDDAMVKLAGASEWRHWWRVNKLGAFGCLALGVAVLVVVIPWTRPFWPFATVLGLPTLLYALLTKTPRYKRVDALRERHEKGLPHFVLHLKPTATRELAGGWVAGL